jgi:hypothetical protein
LFVFILVPLIFSLYPKIKLDNAYMAEINKK